MVPLALLFVVPNAHALLFGIVSMGAILACQELHKWSHTIKSDAPRWVNALQDAGLIVSRRTHLAHHKSPFASNYCIVSGHCNGPLDRAGVWLQLERAIYAHNGVKPRSWTLETFEFEQ